MKNNPWQYSKEGVLIIETIKDYTFTIDINKYFLNIPEGDHIF